MGSRPEVVLADVLAVAADRGRLVEADRLLRELVAPEAVNSAHKVWTDRLREWVVPGVDDYGRHGDRESPGHDVSPPGHDVATPEADGDALALLRSIRATAPAGGAR